MLSFRTVFKPAVAIAGVMAVVGLAGSARASASGAAAKEKKAAAATVAHDPGAYVGEETCLTCHEGQSYKGSAHALKTSERTPMATHGCESCNGPGKAHVDGGGDKTKIVDLRAISPQASSEYCTSCHTRGSHALWSGSQHDGRNVGCLTCHSVHSAKGAKQLKAASEADVCAACHRNIVNKQYRLNHMPVREDKMSCSSCHNVHGSTNVRLLKTGNTIDEACTSCHAEKRGPYLWEHAPVVNSCTSCHDPHGSNNDRMLVAKQPYLCQRCHVTSRHPPTVYEGYVLQNSTNANKIFGRSCASCHQQIHGSNAPSGKAFLR